MRPDFDFLCFRVGALHRSLGELSRHSTEHQPTASKQCRAEQSTLNTQQSTAPQNNSGIRPLLRFR